MIADIKPRAKEIMKADGLNLTIGAGIFVLIDVLAAQIGGGIISDALSGLITSVCAACSACFFFRAYNRGKADINDVYSLLTDSVHMPKMLTIILAMWLIHFILGICSTFMAFIPVLGLIAVLVITLIVSFALLVVWYLFVANPDYPTEYYLKGSMKYMKGNYFMYFGFVISVIFVPALIEGAVALVLGNTIASVLCIPFEAYINLCIAGFFSYIIPDHWFNGTEVF